MANKLVYSIKLTAEEYTTLDWLEGHGYSGDLIKHATDVVGWEGGVILRFSEADAWKVQDEYNDDSDAFGACAGPTLLAKMHVFLDGIV